MKRTSVSGLSLRDLEYVQAIAGEKSFGRAALVCGISQPAISQQISKLEARLGFVLFERHGRQISLTENGKIFARKVDVILTNARELLELSSSLRSPMQGELKVGVIPTLGPYLIPLMLRVIRSSYPKLKLSLIEEPTDTLERMLAERKLDALLLATEPKTGNSDAVELFFEPYVYACPDGFGFAQGSKVTWNQVDKSTLLLLSVEHCLRDQTMALCDLVEQPGQRIASSLEMLRQMVALGEGAALLPILSVSGPDRFKGLLTLHPITDGHYGRTVRLAWRSSDPRADYLRQFGVLLQEHMQSPHMQKYFTLS